MGAKNESTKLSLDSIGQMLSKEREIFEAQNINNIDLNGINRGLREEKIYDTLSVITHNINGIKNNNSKLYTLMDFVREKNIQIVGLCETNISEKEGKAFIKTIYDYRCIWSKQEKDKIKGKGTAILVSKKWEKHIAQIENPIANFIKIRMDFKRFRLHVYQLYISHDNKEENEATLKALKYEISKQKKHDHYIIMGDFNTTPNPSIDRYPIKRQPKSKIMEWLKASIMIDTFRSVNPREVDFTWTNNQVQSRIDMIWISNELAERIIKAKHIDAEFITGSDHKIVNTKIDISKIIHKQREAQGKKANRYRKIYLYKEATEEQWERYKEKLENIVKHKKLMHLVETANSQMDLDKIWEILNKALDTAATEYIPNKRIRNGPKKDKQNKCIDEDRKYLNKLGQFIRKCRKKLGKRIDDEEKIKINRDIDLINAATNKNIYQVKEEWNMVWLIPAKQIWKELNYEFKMKEKREKSERIKKKIEERCSNIQVNQRQFISSIFDKQFRKIEIDRLIEMDENNEELLITEPEEVMAKASAFYKTQFRKRQERFNDLNDKWKGIYNKCSEKDIYKDLLKIPTEDEWNNIMRDVKDTAPGFSGIGYKMLKRTSEYTKEILRKFAGACYKLGSIPLKWKVAQIYPIPKPKEWNYNLGNARPIILLECLRKAFIKIINNRLGKIIKENNVLKGNNFCGLKGDNTNVPIHIMQNFMEYCREKKEEMWIVLQDMAKAFDSVSMVSLRKSLERIGLPQTAINLLVNIFEGRKMRVITTYGLSPEFQAGDGIDQGETISPLIWRIFYDPLLEAVQQDQSNGCIMKLEWPIDIKTNAKEVYTERIAAAAYVDDTVWVAKSKSNMEKIISISDEFFDINDIKINGDKSEVIVINSSMPKEETNIMMGQPKVKISSNIDKPSRYLGIWFKSKAGKTHVKEMIKEDIKTFIGCIRCKIISNSHVIYLVNKVLLPKLEYRIKTTVLTDGECMSLFRPLLKIVKKKMGLVLSTPNATLMHEGIVGLRNLWQIQLESHAAEFFKRINNNYEMDARTTIMRLKQAQLDLGLTENIFNMSPQFLTKHRLSNNLSYEIVVNMSRYLIKPSVASILAEEWKIKGIGRSIQQLIFEKGIIDINLSGLQKYGLFFINQIIGINGNQLLTWSQIRNLKQIKSRGRKPKWFKVIEELMIIKDDFDRNIKLDYRIENYNEETIMCKLKRPTDDKRKHEWVMFIDKEQNNRIEIGKIVEKKKITEDKNAYWKLQHWAGIGLKDEEDKDIIRPCEGCKSTKEYDTEDRCIIYKLNNTLFDIGKVKQKTIENYSYGTAEMPLDTIKYVMENSNKIRMSREMEKNKPLVYIIDIEDHFIEKWISNNDIKKEFIDRLNRFKGKNINSFGFYTDGSLLKHKKEDSMRMGYGWIEEQTGIQMGHRIRDWFSSTRAELFAIWSALLCAPYDSKITIFTDSQSAIDLLKKFGKLEKISVRDFFNINNASVIAKIIETIRGKNLHVEYIKIKAHNGIEYNEVADKIAKRAAYEGESWCLTYESTDAVNILFTPIWNGYIIDKKLRSFVKDITGTSYELEWSLLKYNIVDFHDSYSTHEWNVTWTIFDSMKGNNCTTMEISKNWSWACKLIDYNLPTLDKMHERYPDIYEESECILCGREIENMEHLSTCIFLEQLWRDVELKLWEEGKRISDEMDLGFKKEEIRNIIWGETDFNKTISEIRLEMFVGKVSEIVFKNFYKKIGKYNVCLIFVKKLLIWFREAVKGTIWKKRCYEVARWEGKKGVIKGTKYRKISLSKIMKGIGIRKNINNKGIKINNRLSEFNGGGTRWENALKHCKKVLVDKIKNGYWFKGKVERNKIKKCR